MPDSEYDIEAVVAGVSYQLARCQERAHIIRPILKGIERFDEVTTLVESSESRAAAQERLMDLWSIDGVQAAAVLDMQVGILVGERRQKLADEYARIADEIADLESTLASPERQRELVGTDRGDQLARGRPIHSDGGGD